MSELSSIEIIKKYAASRSYPIVSQQKITKAAAMSSYIDQKALILDLQSIEKDLYFVFYDTYGNTPSMNNTYCGLFKKIKELVKSEVRISKRDSLDFLRFRKRFKTNNSYTNKSLSIYTTETTIVNKFINRNFVKAFLQLNKEFSFVEFIMDNDFLSYSKELSEKNKASLRVKNWITDDKQLDLFIEKGAEILRGLK